MAPFAHVVAHRQPSLACSSRQADPPRCAIVRCHGQTGAHHRDQSAASQVVRAMLLSQPSDARLMVTTCRATGTPIRTSCHHSSRSGRPVWCAAANAAAFPARGFGGDASLPWREDQSQQALDDETRGHVTPEAETTEVPDGPVDLTGVWEKDMEKSDLAGYEKTLDLLKVSGMQKVTARLIEGMQLEHTADTFTVSYLTIVPFFRVTEAMSFGRPSQLKRRDLRSGTQTTTVQPLPGGVLVHSEWGSPLAGSVEERYELQPDGDLHVTSRLVVEGKTGGTVLVFRRSGNDRAGLLRESSKRNSSVPSMLKAR